MAQATISSYDTDEAIFVLAITLTDTGEYIGSLGASPDSEADAIEIFYTLLPDYRGKGFAIEATQKLIEYLQKMEKVSRSTAYVVTENLPSIKVAERLEMTFDVTVIKKA